MTNLKCPKCGTTFTIDETEYNDILMQIRDAEFEKRLKDREADLEEKKSKDLSLFKEELNHKHELELINKKEETDRLKFELNQIKDAQTKEIELAEARVADKYKSQISDLELKLAKLASDLKLKEEQTKQEIKDVILDKEKHINELEAKIELNNKEYQLKEQSSKEKYAAELKTKDDLINYYKDLKARQSTKMIGETLEQHCNAEFSRIRPIFGLKTYFEKDNDARTGSKGDFIFRDYDNDGNEIISIMFEMKNEADETASKHKNEDFFKELDKDRKEKNCEYAVLVSLLEIDNEIYNTGIVDVSYKYDKMYVVRPQFFVPIITLLRNAALKSLDYKKELIEMQNQNIDIAEFEEKMNAFKDGFSRNYKLASDKFKKAIEEIDKTIDHLQKTKDALLSSENNLRLANNKAEDLTIKKLTQGNKTMTELFENLNKNTDEQE